MSNTNSLEQLFPALEEIPPEYLLPSPVHQDATLVGGVLRPWRGDTQPVFSPIWLRAADGGIHPPQIGRPAGDPAATDAALAAAVAAYDNGRGIWADHGRRWPHRLHGNLHPKDAGMPRRGSALADVGNQQESRGC